MLRAVLISGSFNQELFFQNIVLSSDFSWFAFD